MLMPNLAVATIRISFILVVLSRVTCSPLDPTDHFGKRRRGGSATRRTPGGLRAEQGAPPWTDNDPPYATNNDQETNDLDDEGEEEDGDDDYSDYSDPHVEGEAERKLLTSFGLSALPKLDKKAVKEAPSFMLDLYEKLQSSQNAQKAQDFTHDDSRTPTANTVRSYAEKGIRSSGRKLFEFEISGILDRETIVSAEIVLYKRPSRTSDFESMRPQAKRAVIEIYHVFNLERNGILRRRKTLVDQRLIHLSHSGMLQFNVTSAFINKAHRVRISRDNASVLTRTFEVKVRARSAPLKRMVRFIKYPADNRPEKQPLLVLYLNDNMIQRRDISMPLGREGVMVPRPSNKLKTQLTTSNRLETRLENNARLERRLEDATAAVERNIRTDSSIGREHRALRRKRRAENRSSSRPGRSRCQLEEYEVNFNDIGWTTWIVAPSKYYSNFCEGYCPFPLDSHFNGTNHAAVQAIVHTRKMKRKDGKRVPSPCCVPNTFTGLSVLYLDNEKNVVMKDFDQMVATSCGCH